MRYSALQTALTVAIVLCVSSCSTSRTATREVSSSSTSEATKSITKFQVSRDTIREEVIVAVHDTIIETKTITITKNEVGDTTFTSIVTERDRFRDRAAVRDKEEKMIVRNDTVYVEKCDSVLVERHQTSAISHQTSILKWIFAIILALTVLMVVIRWRR